MGNTEHLCSALQLGTASILWLAQWHSQVVVWGMDGLWQSLWYPEYGLQADSTPPGTSNLDDKLVLLPPGRKESSTIATLLFLLGAVVLQPPSLRPCTSCFQTAESSASCLLRSSLLPFSSLPTLAKPVPFEANCSTQSCEHKACQAIAPKQAQDITKQMPRISGLQTISSQKKPSPGNPTAELLPSQQPQTSSLSGLFVSFRHDSRELADSGSRQASAPSHFLIGLNCCGNLQQRALQLRGVAGGCRDPWLCFLLPPTLGLGEWGRLSAQLCS